MPVKSCLVGVNLILTLGAAQAATEKCPAKSTQMDDVIAALNETLACDRAMKVFAALRLSKYFRTRFPST